MVLPDTELEKLEFAMEADAVYEGVREYQLAQERTRQRLNETEQLGPGFGRLVSAITEEQEALQDVRRTPKLPDHGLYLLALAPERLALLTLQSVCRAFQLLRDDDQDDLPALTGVAMSLGQLCARERDFDVIRGRARDVAAALRGRHRDSPMAKRRIARDLASLADWPWQKRLHLGLELLNLASGATELFTSETQPFIEQIDGKPEPRQRSCLTLTEAGEDWLARAHLHQAEAVPQYRPMVVRPRDWRAGSLTGGGYLTEAHTRLASIKLINGQITPQIARTLTEMPPNWAIAALNALQATPWRINCPVLACIEHLARSGVAFGDLPERQQERLPEERPEDRTEAQYRYERRRAQLRNVRRIAKANHFHARVDLARLLVDQGIERLWFPWQFDYRGRAYPLPTVFSPQADDLGRALLEFAEGKELGDDGADWLKVQLVHCYANGEDKRSFAERHAWVETHETEIRALAQCPEPDHPLWAKARHPWQFLAACFEWDAYCTSGRSKQFCSRLPVAQDGSCNGLQHYSGMVRDSKLAAKTNVFPDPEGRPRDIYSDVAARARQLIDADAKQNNRYAAAIQPDLQQIVTRDLAKKPTMTLVYGASRQGVRRYLLETSGKALATVAQRLDEDFLLQERSRRESEAQEREEKARAREKKARAQGKAPTTRRRARRRRTTVDQKQAKLEHADLRRLAVTWLADYLAGTLLRAVGEEAWTGQVTKAWLRHIARQLAACDLGVEWQSPSGFTVVHEKRMRQVEIRHGPRGRRTKHTVEIWDQTAPVVKAEQISGIAANFIHALDAAHLVRTITRLRAEGVDAVATVHDSFATHAGAVSHLRTVLQAEFAATYRTNVPDAFYATQQQRLDAKLAASGSTEPVRLPSLREYARKRKFPVADWDTFAAEAISEATYLFS